MTKEQKAILSFVVADADAWMAHGIEHRGEEWAQAALEAKVERHRAAFKAAQASGKILSRVERDAAAEAKKAADAAARPSPTPVEKLEAATGLRIDEIKALLGVVSK